MKRKSFDFKRLLHAMIFFAFIVPVFFTGNARAVTILETSPGSNDEETGVDTLVSVMFSEAMESFDESKFYVVTYPAEPFASPQSINGTVTYDNKVATWTPTESLAPDTKYFVTILGGANGVKEQGGNTLGFDYKWKFNTGLEDVIDPNDPAILETSSFNGEKDVPANASVYITFAEGMTPDSINEDTFYVMTYPQDPFAPGERITDVKVNYSEDNKTATWELAEGYLAPDTDYYVTVAGINGVRDQSGGSPLTFDYRWKFTTGSDMELVASIDSPAPTVTINEGTSLNFQGTVENGGASLIHSWDFGGGAENSDAEDPGDIVFDTEGIYTVTFTVTDDADNQESSSTVTVTVIKAGELEISMMPSEDLSIGKGNAVDFQGIVTAGNVPLTYSWDFGGSAENSDAEYPESVTFETDGNYIVTLTVTDKDGRSESVSVTITVGSVRKGDIDGNGYVNLTDAILAVQICAGITSLPVYKEADVNNDGRIGIEEAVYILAEIVNNDII